MDDFNKITCFASKAPYAVTPLKTGMPSAPHRCSYGSTGRCPCGLHRTPERAVGVVALSSDRERLSIEL